jgi:uncharacterized membrane protein
VDLPSNVAAGFPMVWWPTPRGAVSLDFGGDERDAVEYTSYNKTRRGSSDGYARRVPADATLETAVVTVTHAARRWVHSEFAADIGFTLGVLLLANLVVLGADGPVRFAAAALIAVVLPGYALTTVLFPVVEELPTGLTGAGVSPLVRVTLSVALSVFITAFVGLALADVGEPLAASPLLLALDIVVVVLFGLGVVRRLGVSVRHRYVLPFSRLRDVHFEEGPTVDTALDVGLVAIVVLSVSTVGYALAAPQDGTEYTSARLLTEMPSGEYGAAGYEAYDHGERGSYTLALENHEGRTVRYTAVVAVQRVRENDGGMQVVASRRLRTLEATVPASETQYLEHEISPPIQGERLRLVYMVYRGSPPERPTTDSAYRYLQVWITVGGG